MTNLASSVARNMEKLSFDEEHFSRNEALRRSQASGLTSGIVQGLSSLGISILGKNTSLKANVKISNY